MSLAIHWNRLWILFFLCIPGVVPGAQTRDYEDRIIEHMQLLDTWQSYLFDFPSRPNLAPPGDVQGVARAVAELYAAFHDEHESENEPDLREAFQDSMVSGFPNQYRVISERLTRTAKVLEQTETESNRTERAFQLDRLREMVEWHYFALPLLLYEGQTPYHDMYRKALLLYVQHVEPRHDTLDLLALDWPIVSLDSEDVRQVTSTPVNRVNQPQPRTSESRLIRQQDSESADSEATSMPAESGGSFWLIVLILVLIAAAMTLNWNRLPRSWRWSCYVIVRRCRGFVQRLMRSAQGELK